jgi:predicted nucleic acid-binding protein
MLDARALIKKHRGRGVFVDTNLLVLFLIGSVNPDRIKNCDRTGDFSKHDFIVLRRLLEWFGSPLVTTPHVLSQVSDLAKLSGQEAVVVRQFLKATVEIAEEIHDAAKQLVRHRLFERFGLADASIGAVCERNIVVLTTDVQLQVALGYLGLDAINFNHVRTFGWES